MAKKIRIYLDTSVISYLEQEERKDKYEKTIELWDFFKDNSDIEIFISDIVLIEIDGCDKIRKNDLLNSLEEISYGLLEFDEFSQKIRDKLLEYQVLSENSISDCSHIAIAIANGCDYILSWNFRHFVKDKTKNGVNKICNEMNLKSLDILSPSSFLDVTKGGK